LAAPPFSIPAFVASKSLPGFAQSIEQRQKQETALRKGILDVRRIPAIVYSDKQLVFFHIAQAPDESTTADRIEVAM